MCMHFLLSTYNLFDILFFAADASFSLEKYLTFNATVSILEHTAAIL